MENLAAVLVVLLPFALGGIFFFFYYRWSYKTAGRVVADFAKAEFSNYKTGGIDISSKAYRSITWNYGPCRPKTKNRFSVHWFPIGSFGPTKVIAGVLWGYPVTNLEGYGLTGINDYIIYTIHVTDISQTEIVLQTWLFNSKEKKTMLKKVL